MFRVNDQTLGYSYDNDTQDTLLSAALRNGIGIPYECNSGGCGACKFELIDGEIEELYPDAPGLSARDRRKGKLLACQCKPKSDVDIKITNTIIPPPAHQPSKFKAHVIAKQFVSEEMFYLHLQTDNTLNFTPGQYFMVNIPGLGTRAYSAANPLDNNKLSLMIKTMPDGKVSNHLAQQSVCELEIDGPYGTSVLKHSDELSSVFIAGGSGIAPMLSMVKTLIAQQYAKPIIVFFGSRLEAELNAAKELFGHAPNLQLINVLSDSPADNNWNGEKGYLHEVIPQYIENFDATEFYLCGPPVMITAVQKLLMIENRVSFENIHFDRFF